MKKIIVFIVLLIVSIYTLFLTSWTGSYLMLEHNWQNKTIFTPEDVSDPRDIYFIDQWLYAFTIQPITSTIFIIASIVVVSMIIFHFRKRRKKKKQDEV
ncbi:YjdJ family protein [Virgibacillus sp. AGTR]|uniref:DUF4306 domain-containing protein n=1 Tax=Virgibacillus sp. AGTR TaxID=2812055 RepID=UPI00196567DA|nr:DUF4306 domain-containing protein [Virgibacillus sp. AGTR]MCC2249892.1 YjdJ family protein [Virgibacillus sp. AGTR]QRZ18665.1 DUF4306 domain-containing protein [Virgibacillus sp. AGTR]